MWKSCDLVKGAFLRAQCRGGRLEIVRFTYIHRSSDIVSLIRARSKLYLMDVSHQCYGQDASIRAAVRTQERTHPKRDRASSFGRHDDTMALGIFVDLFAG